MKVFWIFCLIFCLGWPSFSLAGRFKTDGLQTGTQKNKLNIDKRGEALRKDLIDSGLVVRTELDFGDDEISIKPSIQEELTKYCPNDIKLLSRVIPVLFHPTKIGEIRIAITIKPYFRRCVGKIVSKSDELVESFVKPVNSAYSNKQITSRFKVIDPTVKSHFDAGGGVKTPSKFKELADKLDHYMDFNQSCWSSIAQMRNCFVDSTGRGHGCIHKYSILKDYLETTVKGKSCGETMDELSDYSKGTNFRRFVNLPGVCSAGGDAGLTKIRGFLLGNPALPEGSNMFSKCEKIITESKKCACDNQGICWPGENACENRKHYPEFEQQCQREIQNCQNNCLAEIDKFKTAYLEYFYLGRFDSFGVHSQASACKNPINELSGLFQQSIGAYDQDLRNNNFNNLNGLGIRGQLENAIVAKCENIVTELQKKKESVEENCAKEKEEEKDEEKSAGETKTEDNKNTQQNTQQNTPQQNQNYPSAQTYKPTNTGFGNNSYYNSNNTEKKRMTSKERIARMDPNIVAQMERITGKPIHELTNIGIGDSKSRLHRRHGSLIWGSYRVPTDLTEEEKQLLYDAFEQEVVEEEEAFRQKLAKVGASPGDGYFDENDRFHRYPDRELERMRDEAFGKPSEPEPTLKEKIHNDLDPKIRDFLRAEETAYRDMEDEEQARHNAGLRGKLRGLRRFAKREALAAYNAFVPESREAFRRRLGILPEGVDAREVHALIMTIVCFKEKYDCGKVITEPDYHRAVDRLEELSQMSLTIPDFSDPEEKPKTE